MTPRSPAPKPPKFRFCRAESMGVPCFEERGHAGQHRGWSGGGVLYWPDTEVGIACVWRAAPHEKRTRCANCDDAIGECGLMVCADCYRGARFRAPDVVAHRTRPGNASKKTKSVDTSPGRSRGKR